MGENPAEGMGVGDNYPVYYVSWNDCLNFISALNDLPGMNGFRFPTEAEWEFACRGSAANPNRYNLFSFGDDTGLDLNTSNWSYFYALCRSSMRFGTLPGDGLDLIGFRLCISQGFSKARSRSSPLRARPHPTR